MKKMALLRTIVLLCTVMVLAGCIGPMNASQRLRTWNREIENRWAGEGVYILTKAPYGGVAGLFFLSDVIIWNSIEFWGGTNPIDPVAAERRAHVRELDAVRHEGRTAEPEGSNETESSGE